MPRTASTCLGIVLLGWMIAPAAYAARPANDRVSQATDIDSLPFSDTIDTREAVTDRRDPDCVGQGATVWYEFSSPVAATIEVNTFGSSYDTTLSVYVRSGNRLDRVACNDDSESLQSLVTFSADAGTTYLIMAGSFAGGAGGDLVISANAVAAIPLASFQLAIDSAVLRAGGSVRVTGRVMCAQPMWVWLSGQIVQKYRGESLRAPFGDFLWCNGTTSWITDAVPYFQRIRGVPLSAFSAGAALVDAAAGGHDPQTEQSVVRSVRRRVTLRQAQ